MSVYFDILPSLYNTVIEIIEGNLKGGQLLDLIYNKSQTGNTYLKDSYSKIMSYCYKILY